MILPPWVAGARTPMRIVIDPNEERLNALVRYMHATGMSMHQIVTELRVLGVVDRAGKPLRLTHVWDILRALRTSTSPQ
jgi:hypothetical protein